MCLWRGGGVVYLAMLLVGLAAGLWPEAIHQSQAYRSGGPLPVLQTVAVAQCAYFLLVWPIMLAARVDKLAARGDDVGRVSAMSAIGETAVLIAVAAPFYVGAGYLANSTSLDVCRTAISVLCVLPLAWAGALWAATGSYGKPWTVLAMLLLAFGGAAGWYIAREFAAASSTGVARAMWELSPITYVWSAGQGQVAQWVARPVWPVAAWGVAASVACLANVVFVRRRGCKEL